MAVMAAAVVDSVVVEAVVSVVVAAASTAVDSGAAVLRSTAAGSEAAAWRSIAAAFAPRRCFVVAACATDIATSITGRIFITGITSTAGSTRRAITATRLIMATGTVTAAWSGPITGRARSAGIARGTTATTIGVSIIGITTGTTGTTTATGEIQSLVLTQKRKQAPDRAPVFSSRSVSRLDSVFERSGCQFA